MEVFGISVNYNIYKVNAWSDVFIRFVAVGTLVYVGTFCLS